MKVDWERIREYKISEERPEGWPDDVYAITQKGLSLFGIHKEDDKLYWDGREIVTKKVVRLRGYETFLASIAAFATLGIFVLDIGSAFSWWN